MNPGPPAAASSGGRRAAYAFDAWPRAHARRRPKDASSASASCAPRSSCFTAHGFRGASLDAVAAAVGISRQGVLHYFPSKTNLLLGVLELRDEESIARAEERARTRRRSRTRAAWTRRRTTSASPT